MARMKVRGTYTLDVETVQKLENLAKTWGVSKSEALRRSIQSATVRQIESPDPLQAFDALQRTLHLTNDEARRWARSVRSTRRATSSRRLSNS